MLDRMGQELNLTAAQKAQIRSIQEDQARKTGAIFENRSLSREQRREQMRQARAEADAQVKAALNPDQQMKFDEMQTRQRAWMEAMRGGRMGGFPPGRPMGGPPPGGMRPPDSPLPGGMPPSGEPGGRNQ